MTDPKVSVICIFYNAERFIAEAVDSVLAQDFRDFELLLADDGSTDSSSAIAKDYESRFPGIVRYLEFDDHSNRGMSAARNLGIRNAKGEFLAFIDSDDRWRTEKLQQQVEIMAEWPAAAMLCGAVNYWRSWSGGKDRVVVSGYRSNLLSRPPETALRQFPLGGGEPPCPSEILLRREAVEAVGGFEEQFLGPMQVYEDQAFFAKIYLKAPVLFTSHLWLDYRIHPDSCVAVVRREGSDAQLRLRYFDWFEGYLVQLGLDGDRRLRRALGRRRWELKHPLPGNAIRAVRRAAHRVRSLMSSRASPSPSGGR